jgi:hypothetical protein
MKLLLETPLNSLSFGNVSYNLIKEFQRLDVELGLFPTGGNVDLAAFDIGENLKEYIQNAINERWSFVDKEIPSLKLWHFNGSENRKNKDQHLFTFYECSEPTKIEKATCAVQDSTIFSSTYAKDMFEKEGCDNTHFIPLGFDEEFKRTDRKYLKDIVHFGLMGKFENRKHTKKIIQTWLSKYGNDPKYQLSCCINNPFFKPEQMHGVWQEIKKGKNYNNLNIIPHLDKNAEVNELLNAIDIDLTGLSGGEGWNLPAFNATCLGKWSIVLNETSHKDWATKDNCILVESTGRSVPSADGMFFTKGSDYNQGDFYAWDEETVLKAMEEAETKVGQINTEGVKLGDSMTYKKTAEAILALIYKEN